MSITNYNDLIRAIGDFSHRTDIRQNVTDFIQLAEDRIDQDLIMRSNELRATTTAQVDSRFLPLPDDFFKMRALTIAYDPDVNSETDGYVWACLYRAPQVLNEAVRTTSGKPQYFTVTSQMEFERPFDYGYTVEMSYFSRLIPLSEINQTNDVLTNYPTLYLYGALFFLSLFEKDNEETAKFETLFVDSINKANRQEKRGRYGPAPRMASMGPTP